MSEQPGVARRVEMLEDTVNSLKQLPQRFGVLESRMAAVEGRLEVVDRRLEVVDQRLEVVDQRLEVVDQRLEVVELQIVHLRTEMRGEFSAIRQELATKASKDDLERFATKEDLARKLREALVEVGGWILASEERSGRQMRVLHEDVIARIAALSDRR